MASSTSRSPVLSAAAVAVEVVDEAVVAAEAVAVVPVVRQLHLLRAAVPVLLLLQDRLQVPQARVVVVAVAQAAAVVKVVAADVVLLLLKVHSPHRVVCSF
jgi:hypothetical protein